MTTNHNTPPAPAPAVDLRASLGMAREYARLAIAALADEHEGNVAYYVTALETLARSCGELVRTW